jgi:D-alanyl-D-alanine carboxypeptidase
MYVPSETPPVSTRPAADLVAEAHRLGVPRDHGMRRKLKRVREARSLMLTGRDTQNRPVWMTPRASHAWNRMCEAATRDGVTLQIVSAFRGIEYQLDIIRRKLERGLAMDEILRMSAAPGYSEHHSGRAFDLTTPGYKALEEEFEKSPAFAWLSTNANVYGFAMSYPRGNKHGIAYEPWHWCWQEKRRKK